MPQGFGYTPNMFSISDSLLSFLKIKALIVYFVSTINSSCFNKCGKVQAKVCYSSRQLLGSHSDSEAVRATLTGAS